MSLEFFHEFTFQVPEIRRSPPKPKLQNSFEKLVVTFSLKRILEFWILEGTILKKKVMKLEFLAKQKSAYRLPCVTQCLDARSSLRPARNSMDPRA